MFMDDRAFLLFVLSSKFENFFFDIIILLTNVFGDIRRSIKLPKQFQKVYEEIVDKKSILVAYVG